MKLSSVVREDYVARTSTTTLWSCPLIWFCHFWMRGSGVVGDSDCDAFSGGNRLSAAEPLLLRGDLRTREKIQKTPRSDSSDDRRWVRRPIRGVGRGVPVRRNARLRIRESHTIRAQKRRSSFIRSMSDIHFLQRLQSGIKG